MNTEKYPNSAKAARTIWLVLLFTVCPLYAINTAKKIGMEETPSLKKYRDMAKERL